MSAAELEAAGIGEELVRISVGLEGMEDIVDDFAKALRASGRA
jgi:O-acetylhomoserine (thiol)-lyase